MPSRYFLKLPDHKVDELDEIDRAARPNAQRQGRSHVKALGSAITVAGKLVGHVTSSLTVLARAAGG